MSDVPGYETVSVLHTKAEDCLYRFYLPRQIWISFHREPFKQHTQDGLNLENGKIFPNTLTRTQKERNVGVRFWGDCQEPIRIKLVRVRPVLLPPVHNVLTAENLKTNYYHLCCFLEVGLPVLIHLRVVGMSSKSQFIRNNLLENQPETISYQILKILGVDSFRVILVVGGHAKI